jgi:hypothetical protein
LLLLVNLIVSHVDLRCLEDIDLASVLARLLSGVRQCSVITLQIDCKIRLRQCLSIQSLLKFVRLPIQNIEAFLDLLLELLACLSEGSSVRIVLLLQVVQPLVAVRHRPLKVLDLHPKLFLLHD